jgi:flagellar biosynthesis protein FlhF
VNIRRFVGINSRDVMRQVREALGPDALIISNRSIPGGIEVTAAEGELEEEETAGAPAEASARSAGGAPAQGPFTHWGDPADTGLPARPDALVSISASAALSASFQAPPESQEPVSPLAAALAAANAAAAARAAGAAPSAGMWPPATGAAPMAAAPSGFAPSPASAASTAASGFMQSPAAGTAPSPATPLSFSGAAPSLAPSAVSGGVPAMAMPLPASGALPPSAWAAPALPPAAPETASYAPPLTAAPSPASPVTGIAAPAGSAPPAIYPSAPSASPAVHNPAPEAPPTAYTPAAPAIYTPAPLLPPLNPDGNAQLHDAISALRGAFETRIDGLMWGKGLSREPVGAALFRSLLGAGFSTALARALLERLPEGLDAAGALNWSRNELVSHLPVLRSDDDLWADGGVFALVGPTGVGKTTTLAKLAARCVSRVGRDQVAMLTTDNFRIGATEQLQIYGRLMGVPTHSVRDAAALRQALAELGNRKIVLVDTTGISQRDRNVAQQAALLCNAGRPVRRLLVLNAASQGDTLDEVAHAYRNGVGEDVAGCIITKLDEASRLGAALDTAIRHRLPIHYVSEGQKVPEHLLLPRAADLVDMAFKTLTQDKNLYAPSESDMAALWTTSPAANGQDERASHRRRMLSAAILRPNGQDEAGLQASLDWLAGDAACAAAREIWTRAQGAGQEPAAALSALALAGVKRNFSLACARTLWAMHGKAALGGAQGGSLAASVLASDRGALLAAPLLQLFPAKGARSSFSPAAATADCGDSLLARCRELSDQLGQLPHVHLLDGINTAAWKALDAGRLSWVARIAGGTRVHHDDYATTANAVGKSLGWIHVQEGAPSHFLVGSTRVPVLLMAAGSEVSLTARPEPSARLRLVCARLVDAASGEVLLQVQGVTGMSSSEADAATVARGLVQFESARPVFRAMAHALDALPAEQDALAVQRRAVTAAQLGTACWQLGQAPLAEGLRASLAGLMGRTQALPARTLPVALLRLFALLAMAD